MKMVVYIASLKKRMNKKYYFDRVWFVVIAFEIGVLNTSVLGTIMCGPTTSHGRKRRAHPHTNAYNEAQSQQHTVLVYCFPTT